MEVLAIAARSAQQAFVDAAVSSANAKKAKTAGEKGAAATGAAAARALTSAVLPASPPAPPALPQVVPEAEADSESIVTRRSFSLTSACYSLCWCRTTTRTRTARLWTWRTW